MAKITIFYHPDWLESREAWRRIADFVRGTTERVVNYLIKYPSEEEKGDGPARAWMSRRARCINENDVKPVKTVLMSHLSQRVNFGDLTKNDRMALILADVTRHRVPAQKMYKHLLSAYLDDGRVAVLVDAPPIIADNPVEAEARKERSYQVLYRACTIRSWSYFTDGPRVGQLSEIIVDAPPIVVGKKVYESLKRFYFPKGGVAEDEPFARQILKGEELSQVKIDHEPKEFEIVSEANASVPVIPFVIIGEGLEESSMEMIAQYNFKLLNDRSACDNVYYKQNFQKIFTFGFTKDELKTLSENTIVNCSNPEGQVIAIPPGDAAGMNERIKGLETKLRRHGLKQMNQIVSDGSAQVQSADSKLLDMIALNEWCNEVAEDFEAALTEIYKLHALYENYAEPIRITIPRDFGLDDKETERTNDQITYSQATDLDVLEIRKAILRKGVASLKNLVPEKKDEGEDETRQKLLDAVATAAPPAPKDPFAL